MFSIPIYDYSNETCHVGNVYQFTFNVKFKIMGLEELFLKNFVEKGGKFEVENSYYDEHGKCIVQAKVVKNPLPFLAVFGAIVLGTGSLLYLMGLQLEKVEKVISLPAGKALTYAGTFMVFIIGYKILTS